MATSSSSFASDVNGNCIPILPVLYGGSVEVALTTTSSTALQIHTNTYPSQVARVWAIDNPCFYRVGASDVAVATAADAYIAKDTYQDVPLLPNENYIRARTRTGTATLRVELLGR